MVTIDSQGRREGDESVEGRAALGSDRGEQWQVDARQKMQRQNPLGVTEAAEGSRTNYGAKSAG